ncbi:uncharacterized protein SCHCODRAFT_02491702 [Schizophyllum commune H4-8]|nr:uncharacterized protein SCHCODRAFT_02491702 [Schizophyllum commune H4-8]KAI5895977.1 hypothetical protein SCHCODRAFT_02491702 [Schizophyllum commune H4-8]
MTGKAGWLGDIAYALARLRCPVRVDFVRIMTGSDVDEVIQQVKDSFRIHVRALLSQRRWLTSLRARESMEANGLKPRNPIQYRAYLDIAMPHHLKALTLILTGEHPLLDVRGGWSQRGVEIAPEWRRCRFCEGGIEDGVHALFICNSRAELALLRTRFWEDVADIDPSIRGCSHDPAAWIHALCAHPATCAMLGKFAFDVLQLFGMHRAFSPPTHVWVAASDGIGNQDGGL